MITNKFDLTPFCLRARAFLSEGRITDALALYGDVIQIDPENALAYADRGTAYAMQKQFGLAINDLERSIELGHGEASSYSTIATIYFELKQLEKAIEYFAKAIELSPDYALTYYNRSNVLHELGNDKAAIADLEKCLTYNPNENFKQLILARLALLQKK